LSKNEYYTAIEKSESYEIWGVIEPQSKNPKIFPKIQLKNCNLSSNEYNCNFKITNNN